MNDFRPAPGVDEGDGSESSTSSNSDFDNESLNQLSEAFVEFIKGCYDDASKVIFLLRENIRHMSTKTDTLIDTDELDESIRNERRRSASNPLPTAYSTKGMPVTLATKPK